MRLTLHFVAEASISFKVTFVERKSAINARHIVPRSHEIRLNSYALGYVLKPIIAISRTGTGR